MSLEAVIQENTAALRELIAALANGTPVTKAQVADVVTEAKADKPAAKKQEKAKEDPKPEAAEEVVEEPAATPEPKGEDAAATEITAADITAVVIALGKAGKRPELIELLGKYEVAKGSELHKNDLAGFHKRATAILEG